MHRDKYAYEFIVIMSSLIPGAGGETEREREREREGEVGGIGAAGRPGGGPARGARRGGCG